MCIVYYELHHLHDVHILVFDQPEHHHHDDSAI